MNEKQNTKVSKFLSLVLRHNPSVAQIKLNDEGWANIEELIKGSRQNGMLLDLDTIEIIVNSCKKQRFSLSEDKTQIRANQGHSLKVDLKLDRVKPPQFLYHGTATRFLDSILKDGLKPMKRHHVHLSQEMGTASSVGKRHGKLIILKIDAYQMHLDGLAFYLSENNVWLVDSVSVKYISLVD